MPTYEYACRSCGEHLEVVQSFKDDPLTECPSCQGTLRKVFSPIGITFKGSGFYKTDSRPATKTGSGSSDSSTPTKTESPSAGSGDSGGGSSGSSDKAATSSTTPASSAAAS